MQTDRHTGRQHRQAARQDRSAHRFHVPQIPEQKYVEDDQNTRRQTVHRHPGVHLSHEVFEYDLEVHVAPRAPRVPISRQLAVVGAPNAGQDDQQHDGESLAGSRAQAGDREWVGDGEIALDDYGDGDAAGGGVEEVLHEDEDPGGALTSQQEERAADDAADDGQGVGDAERQEEPGAAHAAHLR